MNNTEPFFPIRYYKIVILYIAWILISWLIFELTRVDPNTKHYFPDLIQISVINGLHIVALTIVAYELKYIYKISTPRQRRFYFPSYLVLVIIPPIIKGMLYLPIFLWWAFAWMI